jgi:hypothetical protein
MKSRYPILNDFQEYAMNGAKGHWYYFYEYSPANQHFFLGKFRNFQTHIFAAIHLQLRKSGKDSEKKKIP